jgi:hypothetical protein
MNVIIRGLILGSAALAVTGCAPAAVGPTAEPAATVSPSTAPTSNVVYSIPNTCDLPAMVEVIDGLGFSGAEDVTPPWEPADGTDLKLAIDAGGIACAWGPPNTDAGVVVYWVPVDDLLWSEASSIWESQGSAAIDVPDVDEDAAFFLYEPQDGMNEFARWELNLRFDDLWIQVGTSSWQDPADGNAVVDAALDIATP